MKMDDPFGRIGQREESRYGSFRETLIKAGVVDKETAEQCRRGIHVNGLRLTAIVAVALIVALILMPKAKALSITLSLLAMLWVTVSVFNGRKFLRRYVREELD